MCAPAGRAIDTMAGRSRRARARHDACRTTRTVFFTVGAFLSIVALYSFHARFAIELHVRELPAEPRPAAAAVAPAAPAADSDDDAGARRTHEYLSLIHI